MDPAGGRSGKTIAQAYGASFPAGGERPGPRIGDGEVVAAADQLSKSGAQLESLDVNLKSNPTFNPVAGRGDIVKEADQWSKDAKLLKDRVKDGKPSSAEAAAVLTRGARLQSFVQNNPVPTSPAPGPASLLTSRRWPALTARSPRAAGLDESEAFPALVLTVVAVGQIVMARTADLTPWKGGGFGMFSTLNHGAYRGVDILIEGPDRSEALDVPPSLATDAARASALPVDWTLRALAEGVAARERRYQRTVTRVVVTVWRTDFNPATLRASERPLRTFTYQVPVEPERVR